VSESLGYEKGIGRRREEAPVFVSIITAMIAIGALVAMIPGVPVISLLVGVASGRHDLEPSHPHRIGDCPEERLLLGDVEALTVASRSQADRADPFDHLCVGGDLVAVQHGEHGVQVHVRPILGHHDRDDPLGRALGEQRGRDLLDHPRLGAFAEEVNDSFPELVVHEDGEAVTLHDEQVPWMLVSVVQQLLARLDDHEQRLTDGGK